jgi:cell division septal protein FtsQ
MGVRAPADRRFKRARVRTPAPRRRWRGFWLVLRTLVVLLAVGLSIYGIVDLAMASPRFQVRHLRVSGTHRLSVAEIRSALVQEPAGSIFAYRLDAARRRLLDSPWVAEATLRRLLPDTLEVDVVERVPAAIARVSGTLFLIDDRGTLIEAFGPRFADLDLPIIDGFRVEPTPGARVEDARANLATRFFAALRPRPELMRRLSQVDVSDAHNAVALLEGDPARLHLGEDRFAERVQAYLDMAPALQERVSAIDYVDLRFDRRVYLRPAPEAVVTRSGDSDAGRGVRR